MAHDTTDVSEEQTRTAAEILEESGKLYEEKEADYGQSWKLVGKTIKLWLDHLGQDSLELTQEIELNSFGLFTRRLDKMVRSFNGWFCADEMQVNESVVETQEDMIPYAAMHCQLAEEYAAMDYSDFTDEDTR